MQYSSATVIIHEGRFKLQKTAISVPEIVLLRALHGSDDTVRDIKPHRWKRVQSFAGEKKRLLDIYGKKAATAKLIEQLFPGAMPRMPTSLKDIATGTPVLDGEDSDDAGDYEDKAPARRGRKGKEPAGAMPITVNVPAAEPGEIRVEGEDEGPAELIDQSDEPVDYTFLNKPKTDDNVSDKA